MGADKLNFVANEYKGLELDKAIISSLALEDVEVCSKCKSLYFKGCAKRCNC